MADEESIKSLSNEHECEPMSLSHHLTAPGPPPDHRVPLPALSEQRRTAAEEPWIPFHPLHPPPPHHLEYRQEILLIKLLENAWSPAAIRGYILIIH